MYLEEKLATLEETLEGHDRWFDDLYDQITEFHAYYTQAILKLQYQIWDMAAAKLEEGRMW